MKDREGSKSDETPMTRTPAENGRPAVTLDTGATVVLPNPADAPPPSKRVGRKKTPPTVAAKGAPGAAATELPTWAKRAASRGTSAEMAAVREAAPKAEPVADPPAPKRGRLPKTAKTRRPGKAAPATPPDSLRAVGNGWLDAMRAKGSSASTLSSYGIDLEVAHEFFGDLKAAEVTADRVAKFNASRNVMKKTSGKPKAKPTILKTRRALRLALTWAEEKGLIKKAPYSD